jgi:hypothetical protein
MMASNIPFAFQNLGVLNVGIRPPPHQREILWVYDKV